MCFHFDTDVYGPGRRNTTKDFMLSYPIFKFYAKDIRGKDTTINWYPSEYLYLEPSGKMYCLAADKNNDNNQVLFGSTLMRQYQYIFDIESDRIGMVRTNCSHDDDMILTRDDYISTGRTFGL